MAKILVVDDEPDMIWAITNVLLSENHSVVSVNSGEEALKKVEEQIIDLVLLDFRLPGMDGIQILEKIKQLKPELPVIMVTGYGGIEEAVQSIKLGAAHYLPKPFDNDNLVEVVNKSLQLDTLKKEGLFGKRIAEKIGPKSAASERNTATAKVRQGLAKQNWMSYLAYSLLLLIVAGGGFFYMKYERDRSREYNIPNSRVSGLSWGGGSLWVSDWFTQSVYQYQLQSNKLEPIKNFTLSGFHITGIAWGNGSIYTCDSWKKKVFRHNIDNTLSVMESYDSPGPNPSGLYHDGKYLWSCDANTRKIYQHALDSGLTILSTYDSPGLITVGMYHDKKIFWTASAVGMKIFKIAYQERFNLEKTFVFPESFDIAQQISAFTMDSDNKIWLTYEGINKIFRKSTGKLQPVQP